MTLLVQVSAPVEGGVRDYALSLQRCWQQAGLASEDWQHPLTHRQATLGQRLHAIEPIRPDAAAAPDARPDIAMLLHFSGYGYAARGLCGWLVDEIETARRDFGCRLRVVTMFHELAASGPPWRSAFWLAAAQGRIAERLARASDCIWTNSAQHERWLRSRLNGATVEIGVQPVFSTIGEGCDDSTRPRLPSLVIFGADSTRQRALRHWRLHAPTLGALGIRDAVEIGPGSSVLAGQHDFAGPPLRFAGRLAADDVARQLCNSRFALLDYPSIHLAKSSVFAACTALGCVVLNTARPGPDADGLQAGTHYLNLLGHKPLPTASEALDSIARAAQTWYRGHVLQRQSVAFAGACGVQFEGQASAPG
jgi:hypothetical protein